MGTFLDMMKEYVEGARRRVAAAEQAHRTTAAELQAANSDLVVWNNAYLLAVKEKEKRQAEAFETQLPMELPGIDLASPEPRPASPDHVQPELNKNKTEVVRGILGAHPSGITPAQLWTAAKEYQVSRPYLYSVLKRLRDNDEVSQRRGGKYVLKPRPVEAKPEEEGD